MGRKKNDGDVFNHFTLGVKILGRDGFWNKDRGVYSFNSVGFPPPPPPPQREREVFIGAMVWNGGRGVSPFESLGVLTE